jgi:hypothetical protein
MSTSTLMLHCGAREICFEELRDVAPPLPQGRWYPIAHARVVHLARHMLKDAGYEIKREKLGISQDNHRFFGVLDLATPIADGITLSVGLRNSTDKTFPIGFAAGTRVFCCDNLAFKAELIVKKRHTLNGESNFTDGITNAVGTLSSFREMEAIRVQKFLNTELSADQADAIILRALERNMIGIRDLGRVIRHWRNPEHEQFVPRTAWSLLNAFTSALKERSEKHPAQYAVQTMRLNALIENSDRTPLLALTV